MNSYDKKIGNELLDKYERSVLSKAGSDRNIRISLDANHKLMRLFKERGKMDEKEELRNAISTMEQKGFIIASFSKYEDFESLELCLEKVELLYAYLGRNNPKEMNREILSVLNAYEPSSFMKDFKEDCIYKIKTSYTYPKNYFADAKELEVILRIIEALLHLSEEVRERDFSVRVLGDSKLFKNYKSKVTSIIADYDLDVKYIPKEEILRNFNIVSNYSYTLIKNQLKFKLRDFEFDLSKLPYEFALSNQMIADMEILPTNVKKIITVENLTSFYGLDEDAVIVYLAGFHNSIKRQLIMKLYKAYPNATYYHFGDIDAGGFWIYQNLKNKTGVPFKSYRMGITELEMNRDNLKELSENDRKRLKLELQNENFKEFHDVIEYMLKHNCKLEQEILD